MKKNKLFSVFTIALALCSAHTFAGNWQFNSTTSKWEKNITPSALNFATMTTTSLRTMVMPLAGGANPNPAITNSTGENLTNGFFAVTGGQIQAGDITDPTNVRKAFTIADTSLVAPNTLRFAQNTAPVADDKAGKFLGYVNLNWYIPSAYNYTNYNVSFKSRIYNPSSFNLQMLVYDMGGVQLGTTQTYATKGWHTATFEQTANRPFRFKMSIPNTAGLFAYFETPELMLTSSTEPTVRIINVTKAGNGSVSAATETVRDQDTQTFTFTPAEGASLVSVTYNDNTVTVTDNNDGTFSFTTPLLNQDANMHVVFSGATTSVDRKTIDTVKYSFQNGNLFIRNLIPGHNVKLFSISGQKVFDAQSIHNELNLKTTNGVYILKIDNESMKIVL